MQEMLNIKGLHPGTQFVGSDEDLTFYKQMGLEYIDASLMLELSLRERGLLKKMGLEREDYWNADALARLREHVESFGLKLAALHLPLLTMDVDRLKWSSIVLKPPHRDRNIERVCKCIEAIGKAGIPVLSYWVNFLFAERSPGWTSGRGGIRYVHFDYDKMKDEPLHPAGPISAEQAWEWIDYFLERVIPVAEECKVKMACHPDDVAVPPGTTYRGVVPVLNSIEGLKRFIDLHPSPYHGLLFCQGCISEFATNPEQVYDAIRYFGSRKKIFFVHFRNLRGGPSKFEETFPDEGDIDMVKAMRIYKEVGYDGMLIPDHVPFSDLDTPFGHRARAFCLGYIKALIQTVESENQ